MTKSIAIVAAVCAALVATSAASAQDKYNKTVTHHGSKVRGTTGNLQGTSVTTRITPKSKSRIVPYAGSTTTNSNPSSKKGTTGYHAGIVIKY